VAGAAVDDVDLVVVGERVEPVVAVSAPCKAASLGFAFS